jgi:DNA-binding LacI/PurR family transcriptional regulator
LVFLTANINTGASRVLWPGILDAAEQGGMNLISYPGGRLKALDHFESQRNVIFDLVNTEHLDGIVCWTSALAGVGTVTSQEIICFQRRYQAMPMVSLSAPIEDCPLVAIDGYFGMQSLVTHLVDDHNYKKIALIRGPVGHPYALERYHAFSDIFKDKGLSIDPALVSPMVNWEEGTAAMEALLDERGLVPGKDFQAVVTAINQAATEVKTAEVGKAKRVSQSFYLALYDSPEDALETATLKLALVDGK